MVLAVNDVLCEDISVASVRILSRVRSTWIIKFSEGAKNDD
jgi:hypothetical protein